MEEKRERQSWSLGDHSLVEGYKTGEIEGRAVMGRLLEKIGLSAHRDNILTRQDGTALRNGNGEPLLIADYLQVADKHGATGIILNFIALSENDARYPVAKEAITRVVKDYLSPKSFNETHET